MYFAAMTPGVAIVLRCGHYIKNAPLSIGFVANHTFLAHLVDQIDSLKESGVTFETDKITLLKKLQALPDGCADIDRMNAKLRGLLRAAVIVENNPVVQHAACGDLFSMNVILQRPEAYIHKIAVAGYVRLLDFLQRCNCSSIFVHLLEEQEKDKATGRTPFLCAAYGAAAASLNFLRDLGANEKVTDKNGRTAKSYVEEFQYEDCKPFFF